VSFQCEYAVIRFQRRVNLAPVLMQSYQLRKPCLLGIINVRSRAILLPFGWKISRHKMVFASASSGEYFILHSYFSTKGRTSLHCLRTLPCQRASKTSI